MEIAYNERCPLIESWRGSGSVVDVSWLHGKTMKHYHLTMACYVSTQDTHTWIKVPTPCTSTTDKKSQQVSLLMTTSVNGAASRSRTVFTSTNSLSPPSLSAAPGRDQLTNDSTSLRNSISVCDILGQRAAAHILPSHIRQCTGTHNTSNPLPSTIHFGQTQSHNCWWTGLHPTLHKNDNTTTY